jgi:type IV secretory pathway VirB2 component (pilin)
MKYQITKSVLKGMMFSALMVLATSAMASTGGDPLSTFLGTFAEFAGGVWGIGLLLISFIGSCIAIALVDDKIVWAKRLGWICGAGAMMVGAAKMLQLFGINGAIF